jgi:hypothetical protein
MATNREVIEDILSITLEFVYVVSLSHGATFCNMFKAINLRAQFGYVSMKLRNFKVREGNTK